MRAPNKNDLKADVVRELLDYNPATGTLVWKSRPNIRPHLNARVVGRIAGRISNNRRTIGVNNKRYLAHRLAWLHFYGEWPKDQIDHVNLDTLDNRIENLREASHSQNQANRRIHRNNKSGYKGVRWHLGSQRWRAEIKLDKRQKSLGAFNTPEEAHAAYCAAAKEFHGEFARTA